MVIEIAQSVESARDASYVKPHSECPQTLLVEIQGVMDRRIAIHGQKLRNLPKPLIILNKGNSNPFHTFPVNFNLAVAQVLKLSRDLFVPVVFATELRFDPSPLAITKTWQGVVHQLHDRCSANAFLSYSVMSMAVLNGTLNASAAMTHFSLTCRSRRIQDERRPVFTTLSRVVGTLVMVVSIYRLSS